MTLSTSLLSYKDCIDEMDNALADERGIRIKEPSLNEAYYHRSRLHQARQLHCIAEWNSLPKRRWMDSSLEPQPSIIMYW